MTRTFDVLCLANSIKHGGRCVAGLRVDTGGWIRPVPTEDGGELKETHYITEEQHEPESHDTIRIQIKEHCPKSYHPENWLIANKQWELIDGEPTEDNESLISDAVMEGSEIFGNKNTSIKLEEVRESPLSNSLALVSPSEPRIRTKEYEEGSEKVRATFHLEGEKYNLPVTDPGLRGYDIDYRPDEETDEEVLFTLSLGEPYADEEGDIKCYKIVADVHTVPPRVI